MIVVQTLVTLDNYHLLAEQHNTRVVAHALTGTAGGHAKVNDVDRMATS